MADTSFKPFAQLSRNRLRAKLPVLRGAAAQLWLTALVEMNEDNTITGDYEMLMALTGIKSAATLSRQLRHLCSVDLLIPLDGDAQTGASRYKVNPFYARYFVPEKKSVVPKTDFVPKKSEVEVVAVKDSESTLDQSSQQQQQKASSVEDRARGLDPRLAYLIEAHHCDIPERQLSMFVDQYGVEPVVERTRQYVHGRALKVLHSAGWLYKALQEGYSPPRGYDRSRYLTPMEREAVREKEIAVIEAINAEYAPPIALPEPAPIVPLFKRAAHTVWETAYGQLQLTVPKEAFDTWLRAAILVAYEDGTYIIGVRNGFAQAWCDERLKGIVARVLSSVARRTCEVRFVVYHPKPVEKSA